MKYDPIKYITVAELIRRLQQLPPIATVGEYPNAGRECPICQVPEYYLNRIADHYDSFDVASCARKDEDCLPE